MNKIFGLGLPKSGTSSLHSALTELGFRSNHNPDDKVTEQEIRDSNYKLSVLNKYDALMDTPIPALFAQLDNAWPDSKFILTVRPIDDWINSVRHAGFNQPYARPKKGSTVDFYNTLLFGTNVFNEERFRWVYETHHHTVQRYFSGVRENRLLILDLGKGDGWEKLCKFLEKPVPKNPFPRSNRLEDRDQLSQLQKKIIGALVKFGIDYRWLRRKGNAFRRKRRSS